MVDTFGKDIISAYTGGVPVVSIFTYGTQVWPTSVPPTPTEYYIKWTPSNVSGSFRVDGVSYRLEDYNGLFTMSEQVSYSFYGAEITYFETNTSGPMTFHAFADCSSLISVSAPGWTGILPTGTFMSCKNLQTVNIPNITKVQGSVFYDCKSLQSINLPVCTDIYTDAFCGCWRLSYVSLPVCKEIGAYAFEFTRLLTSIDLPMCEDIHTYAFAYGDRFETIILRSNSVCSIQIGVFKDTPIASGTGSIYVPASLVTAYQSAQNWSQYSSQIYPIQ